MRYGIPYMGSKNKLAERIVSLLPRAEHLYDVFCGARQAIGIGNMGVMRVMGTMGKIRTMGTMGEMGLMGLRKREL